MLKYFTNAISRTIGFSKTESRGTLILILIIFLTLVASKAHINHLRSKASIPADSTTYYWVKKVQSSLDVKEQIGQKFDKQIDFVNEQYTSAKSYPTKSASFTKPVKKEKPRIVLDLNTTTALELQKVRGIGPSYSERIIKYRDLLGGYADTTQLSEVYGLKQETINELLKSFTIQSSVKELDINSDSIKVLAKHPYISYDLARIIINYRAAHGNIKSSDDLKKIKAIDERTFLRLKPYLE